MLLDLWAPGQSTGSFPPIEQTGGRNKHARQRAAYLQLLQPQEGSRVARGRNSHKGSGNAASNTGNVARFWHGVRWTAGLGAGVEMTGFINAELEVLRDNLECGHCAAKFKGSDSQARKVKYEKRVVYCSGTCRAAATSKKAREQAVREGKKLRKGVLSGPCKTCGKMFESRIDKMFCSMDCYTKSDQFKEMLAENRKKIIPEAPELSAAMRAQIAAKLKKGQDVPCLECGTEFYQKRPSKGKPARKFCSTSCYRSYLAKRFDRWVANPEGLALPQCYDEFLDKEELACVVEGCDWHGQSLTLHMNQAHGIRADEFKRAAGFNLSTGVIAKPLAVALRERELLGVAANMNDADRSAALALSQEALAANPIRYRSLEGREHAKKARAMLGAGPQRTCDGCGTLFQQSTPMGKAKYCSLKCRDNAYVKLRQASAKQRVRQQDGTFKWVAPNI